jgi:predicted kinase
MAKVHLMIGIQGSGKSTFSNYLSSTNNIMIVSTDRVRQQNPSWPEENIWPEVYRLCAENIKNNQDVIFDATNITPKVRERFLNNVLSHFDNVTKENLPFEYIGYFFNVDPKVCMERVQLRNGMPNELYLPPEVVFSYHERLVEPSYEEKFSKIYYVIDNKLVEKSRKE